MAYAVFADRTEAGQQLARRVAHQRSGQWTRQHWPERCVVLALPRGGVPIGVAVAQALHAPLDLLLVRKIGAPFQPELALAALAEGDPPTLFVDDATCAELGIARHDVEARIPDETLEIERRRRVYLGGRPPADLSGSTTIVVDDGVATGTTLRAALRAVRDRGPARLVLAVPVAPADTLAALQGTVDEVICLHTPSPFHAVGHHYRDFHQLSDAEVVETLNSVGTHHTLQDKP